MTYSLYQSPRRLLRITGNEHKANKEQLGPNLCKHILSVHALLGCDTTSRVFGIGKGAALNKICSIQYLCAQAETFYCDFKDTCVDDMVTAGEKSLVTLYNGKAGECIDTLRYQRFCQKVATSTTVVEAKSLPPTSVACKYHSLRVYYQVQEWKGHSDLNPQDWGWKLESGKMIAVQTHLPPAPKELLSVIKCKCKMGCKTGRCTCRKLGLECTTVCGECLGVSCENSQRFVVSDVD